MNVDHDEQMKLLEERYAAVGVDRRTVLKIAAAAAGASAAGFLGGGSGLMRRPLSASAQTAGPDQTFYSYELFDDPVSFDWNLNLYCNAETEVASGLLTFDENLNAVADWAEKWDPNEDGSVWTFHIRKDNKGWTDGTPVTAGDFVWSWQRQLDPKNAAAYAGFLFDIKNAEKFNTSKPQSDGTYLAADGSKVSPDDLGVKAIDDWTLEVTMEGPRAYFPQVVAYYASVPSPRWAVEKYGADKWASGDVPLISNGAFKLDKWTHDVGVECSPNPNHWNYENIKIKRLVTPIVAGGTEVLTYEKGTGDQQLDWVSIGSDNLKRYQSDPDLSKQLKKYVYPGIWMLVPSNGKPPFDKLEVRKALTHAIDRDRLVQLTQQMVSPAYCMVPPGVYGYLDDPEFQNNLKFDKQLALDALKGTEFEGGKNWPDITMHLRSNEDQYNSPLMANDIVAQLKENLGMDVKLQVWPEASWRPELFKNYFQLVWIRWWSDYPDPNNSYGDMFYSQKSSGKRQAWSNKEFDDLVVQGKAVIDPDKRLAVYKKAEEVIQQDVGYIPVVYRQDTYALKPWLKDVPVNKQGYTVLVGNIYTKLSERVSIEGRPT